MTKPSISAFVGATDRSRGAGFRFPDHRPATRRSRRQLHLQIQQEEGPQNRASRRISRQLQWSFVLDVQRPTRTGYDSFTSSGGHTGRVYFDARQKHLPLFSMKLATQESSVLTRGSGTSL